MKRLLILGATGILATLSFAQTVPGSWTQTYGNEFNSGASDLNGWAYDLGNGGPSLPGWGNNELQNYTSDAQNVNVTGGNLNITAIATTTAGKQTYTSARIKSAPVFSQTGGLFEFRAKLPAGRGLWPAVWMLPLDNAYGGWPTSGEIDILESRGQEPQLVQGTLHSGPIWWNDWVQTRTFADSGLMPTTFSNQDWHTYSLNWVRGTATTPGTFTWYVDGVAYSSFTGGWYSPPGAGADAPFDKPFYFLINMAVGGNYVGAPSIADGSYTMQLDYLRAYQAAPVPEPGTLALYTLGAGYLARRRRKR